MGCVPAEIRTAHLPNTKPQHYRYSNQFTHALALDLWAKPPVWAWLTMTNALVVMRTKDPDTRGRSHHALAAFPTASGCFIISRMHFRGSHSTDSKRTTEMYGTPAQLRDRHKLVAARSAVGSSAVHLLYKPGHVASYPV
jgi:hypothetical protein